MGDGLINPPGTPTGSIPTIPIPNFQAIAQQLAAGAYTGGWFDLFWKAFHEHALPGLQSIIGLLASSFDLVAATGLALVGAFQGTNTQGFFILVSEALTDLTGVEFSAEQFQAAFQSGGTIGANITIGGAFLNMLAGELAPGVQLPSGPGVNAASAFLGYGMAFAVREGNLAMLSEIIPEELNFLAGLREYGTGMADALGLGRLTRLAMAPFMKILIQDPLTYDLNKAFLPTMLPVASMFKAMWRGIMTSDQLATNLAMLGYAPAAVNQLEIDSQVMPSADQFIDMVRTGYLDAGDLATALNALAIPPNTQGTYLSANEAGRSATHLGSLISAYQDLMKNRWVSADQVQTDLTAYGLTASEIQWVKSAVAPYLEYASAELSQSDIEDAYIKGLITIDYYATWLTRKGYSPADQQILQYLLLLKQNADQSAETMAAWSLKIQCLTDTAKGYPPPPGLDAQCNPT
jgi:hypothetical protein